MARETASLPVTVVIPTYNRAELVAQAVRSVVAQTRPPREIIVVDDGSTDKVLSRAICEGARLISQTNQGLPAARNSGILSATYEWVAFLDDDDLWMPQKLELQWQLIQAYPTVGFVFTDHSEFDERTVTTKSLYVDRAKDWALVSRKPVGSFLSICDTKSAINSFFIWNFVNVSSLLVRCNLLREIGMFDSGLKGWEDREIVLRLFGKAVGGVVEQPLVCRRLHRDQMTRDKLKLKVDAAEATARIAQRPWLYPPSAAKLYKYEPARWWLEAGEFLIGQKHYGEAQNHLRKSLRWHFSLRATRAYLKAWAMEHSRRKSECS